MSLEVEHVETVMITGKINIRQKDYNDHQYNGCAIDIVSLIKLPISIKYYN